MFDIGWTEMLVIAIVMIVVVGPKDLPRMLRTFGRTTTKLRSMAGDFQRQFNEAMREAELEDVKKSVDSLRQINPANEIKKQLNPFEKAAQDVRAGLDSLKPSQPAQPAAPAAQAAEPLKNGATEIPGVSGPSALPAEPPAIAEPTTEPAGQAVKRAETAQTAAPVAAQGSAAKPAAPKVAAKTKAAAPKKSAKAAAPKSAAKAKPTAAKKKKNTAGSST
jgi:sec-independent protein translocase protein TatB